MPNALIWGANGGIGRALVQQLKQGGWDVLAVARHSHRLRELGVESFDADVSREGDIAEAVMWAAREAGEINLWVYAVGDIIAKPATELTAAEWAATMAANVGGAQATVRHSLPLLAENAHLVFMGAYVDRIMLPKMSAYAAAKGALEAYTQTLAKELRGKRVTLVRAPAVATPFWEKLPFKMPTKGTIQPDDVAAAIVKANAEGHKGMLDL